ncbi:hypothetical protein Tco_0091735, partial [Tanacetum coccineum]
MFYLKHQQIFLIWDISHGSSTESDVPSIIAVNNCSLFRSHIKALIINLRVLRTQSPKLEMIDSLFKKVSDTVDDGVMRLGPDKTPKEQGARSITKKAAVAALGMRYAGAYGQVVFSKTISYGSLYSYALHKYPQKLCYKDQETALKFHVCLNDKKMSDCWSPLEPKGVNLDKVFEGDPSEIRRLCLVEYWEQIIEQTLKHVRVRK